MNFTKALSDKGIKSLILATEKGKAKYGAEFYSASVKDFDEKKIIAIIGTKDGKEHRLTIKW